ncbi:MAG: retropepsin-like aspartic protease family protein [Sphingosinicella sp.]
MSAGTTLFWSALAIAGVILVAPGLDQVTVMPTAAPASNAAEIGEVGSHTIAIVDGRGQQVLRRSNDGHFYAEAQVNGARIRFLIDTGASVVALTRADAQRAGIAIGSDTVSARGAGGAMEVAPIVIDRIALGPVAVSQVRGAVADDLPMSLLGQSFLTHAGEIAIQGDRLVIR